MVVRVSGLRVSAGKAKGFDLMEPDKLRSNSDRKKLTKKKKHKKLKRKSTKRVKKQKKTKTKLIL